MGLFHRHPLDEERMAWMRTHRGILLALASIQISLSAGIIYGWDSFAQIAMSQGIESDENTLREIGSIGIVMTMIGPVVLGFILDHLGPRFCSVSSLIMLSIGFLLLSLNTRMFLLPSICIIAFVGPANAISHMHLSGLFATRGGLVISALSAAFQLSIVIFPLFQVTHLPIAFLSSIMALIIGSLAIVSLMVWPDFVIESKAPQNISSINEDRAQAISSEDSSAVDAEANSKSWLPMSTPRGVYTKSICDTLPTTVWSWSFLSLFVYAVIVIFIMNHLTLDVRLHVESIISSPEEVDRITGLLFFIMPFGAFALPLIGYIVDHFGIAYGSALQHGSFVLYALLLMLADTFNASGLLLSAWAVYGVARNYFFTFIFMIFRLDFKSKFFGTLQGIVFTLAALLFLANSVFISIFSSLNEYRKFQFFITAALSVYTVYWFMRHLPSPHSVNLATKKNSVTDVIATTIVSPKCSGSTTIIRSEDV